MLTNLFSQDGQATVTVGGANQLDKTASLTALATEIASDIFKVIETDEQQYAPLVVVSKSSHDEMDKLIDAIRNLEATDVGFLKTESAEVLDKMIKSQQSKRSRTKTKIMTLDNYKAMMTGAIAERLLRIAANKPKTNGGAIGGNLIYTEEQIAEYAADQDKLRKEIRNVQSKKSIEKSKASFDETSERWQSLLDAEAALKSIRVSGQGSTTVTVVDNRASQIEELIKNIDSIDKLKSAEAKELLSKITATLSGTSSENNEEGAAAL